MSAAPSSLPSSSASRDPFTKTINAMSVHDRGGALFIVKLSNGAVVIVETKGLVDVDVPHKMRRLAQWIADLNALQSDVSYDFACVDEGGFRNHRPHTFAQLLQSFRDFKPVQS